MTVTAVLREPGDWSSTFGWVNHASGELVHTDIGLYLILPPAFMAGLVCMLFMYFSGEHTISVVWSAMLMALGVVLSTIYAINSLRLKRELFKVAAPFQRHATK